MKEIKNKFFKKKRAAKSDDGKRYILHKPLIYSLFLWFLPFDLLRLNHQQENLSVLSLHGYRSLALPTG